MEDRPMFRMMSDVLTVGTLELCVIYKFCENTVLYGLSIIIISWIFWIALKINTDIDFTLDMLRYDIKENIINLVLAIGALPMILIQAPIAWIYDKHWS